MVYDVVTFDSRFSDAFRELNLEWIRKYFAVEKKDIEQVSAPEECVAGGGQVFFVVEGGEAVATCALYKTGPRSFELAKMAVRPDQRGKGYGDVLMQAAEQWAKEQGAEVIELLSNTVLTPAITLYKKHGYEVVHLGPHPAYVRCNIEMRKALSLHKLPSSSAVPG